MKERTLSDLMSTVWGQILMLNWLGLFQALMILVLGLFLAGMLARGAGRLVAAHFQVHQATLVRRMVYYTMTILMVASALHQMGFKLGVLLGAAGVLSVAIGFASQTSASNLISGFFLLAERPFQIGDMIRVNDVFGEILAIDLLSVKLRTPDNLFVRIPNETLVKSFITNFSRFPIRRYDLQLGVAYGEDMDRVKGLIEAVADNNPLCLSEPRPMIIFQGFGSSSVDVQVSVWVLSKHFMDLRNSLPLEIKKSFDTEGVEIPFPHVSLYAGKHSTPLTMQQMGGGQVEQGQVEQGQAEQKQAEQKQ